MLAAAQAITAYNSTVEEAVFSLRLTRPATGLPPLTWGAHSRTAWTACAALTSLPLVCLVVLCQLSGVQLVLLKLAAGLRTRGLRWGRCFIGLEVGV
jgi:hypothetical protein